MEPKCLVSPEKRKEEVKEMINTGRMRRRGRKFHLMTSISTCCAAVQSRNKINSEVKGQPTSRNISGWHCSPIESHVTSSVALTFNLTDTNHVIRPFISGVIASTESELIDNHSDSITDDDAVIIGPLLMIVRHITKPNWWLAAPSNGRQLPIMKPLSFN